MIKGRSAAADRPFILKAPDDTDSIVSGRAAGVCSELLQVMGKNITDGLTP
ncbi:hypothetical protein [Paenibacillus alginolyticus]|uniref:Uncharacterized protein n=1 Tax=Paenibacillus alginolyticus TaxID=59839 RepID=A0ABT4GPU9_9BACL|nr:hypothetical protein [Paenibacillus alginolyticus]MCY9698246.1 hypothetical protein [Paenibacillus alginolyticus]MEC0145658.1 hypothetical protein [Paenibacillus alginolyticus]